MTLIDRNLLGELVNNGNVHYEDIMNIPTVNVNNLIVKELEKIKDKMMDDGAYFQEVEGHTDFVKGISHCIDIAEKELAEIKGDKE